MELIWRTYGKEPVFPLPPSRFYAQPSPSKKPTKYTRTTSLSIPLLYTLRVRPRVSEKDLVVVQVPLRQARKELSMSDAVRIKSTFKGFVPPLPSTGSGYCRKRPYTSRLKVTALGSTFL
jgi:hypothetical protein